MEVYMAIRTNRYNNIQVLTGYTIERFECSSKLIILMDFFAGPEALLVACLFLVLCKRTADSYRVDTA